MSYSYIYGQYKTKNKLITAEKAGASIELPHFYELKTITIARFHNKEALIKAFNSRVPAYARVPENQMDGNSPPDC